MKKYISVVLIVILALSLTACSDTLNNENSSTGGFGTITVASPQDSNGNTLDNATVTLNGKEKKATGFSETLEAGKYTIKVKKDGYVGKNKEGKYITSYKRKIVLKSGNNVTLDPKLYSHPTENVTIKVIEKGATNALSGVTVTVAGESINTDAQGKATLSNVPIFDHQVTLEKKGDVTYERITKTITVKADENNEYTIELPYAEKEDIAIIAKNHFGVKLEGASVYVDGKDTGVDTDAEGKAVVKTYSSQRDITLKKAGYNKLTKTIDVIKNGTNAENTFNLKMTFKSNNVVEKSKAGSYKVTFNPKTYGITEEITEVRIVGSMQSWDVGALDTYKTYSLTDKDGDGVWTGKFYIVGDHEFKFAYNGTTSFNDYLVGTDGFGGNATNYTIGDSADTTNIDIVTIENVSSDNYKITFDPSYFSEEVTEVHLVGGMTGWSLSDTSYSLTKQTDGTWAGTFTFTSPTEFKVAYNNKADYDNYCKYLIGEPTGVPDNDDNGTGGDSKSYIAGN